MTKTRAKARTKTGFPIGTLGNDKNEDMRE
jgi:hypothetical protein